MGGAPRFVTLALICSLAGCDDDPPAEVSCERFADRGVELLELEDRDAREQARTQGLRVCREAELPQAFRRCVMGAEDAVDVNRCGDRYLLGTEVERRVEAVKAEIDREQMEAAKAAMQAEEAKARGRALEAEADALRDETARLAEEKAAVEAAAAEEAAAAAEPRRRPAKKKPPRKPVARQCDPNDPLCGV